MDVFLVELYNFYIQRDEGEVSEGKSQTSLRTLSHEKVYQRSTKVTRESVLPPLFLKVVLYYPLKPSEDTFRVDVLSVFCPVVHRRLFTVWSRYGQDPMNNNLNKRSRKGQVESHSPHRTEDVRQRIQGNI